MRRLMADIRTNPKVARRQQILVKAQQLVLSDVKGLRLLAFYARCKSAR